MYQDKIVLCGANSYEEKFYMNPDFDNLPQHIKDELKIMCVLYVRDRKPSEDQGDSDRREEAGASDTASALLQSIFSGGRD